MFLKAFIHLSLVVGINKIHVIFILVRLACQFDSVDSSNVTVHSMFLSFAFFHLL